MLPFLSYIDNTTPDTISDWIRWLFSMLDRGAYTLLEFIYKVFYNVANATIFSPELIRVFYSRIQLIIGVFMIFLLSFSLLQYIVNPDAARDQKNGAGKLVRRIIVSLFLLTLIIPLNIPNVSAPAENERPTLNYMMNTHGILFGMLYKFQESVLYENIVPKIMLGTVASDDNTDNSDTTGGSDDVGNLSYVGNDVSKVVARAFLRPNVVDENEPYCDYEDPNDPCPNVACPTQVYEAGYSSESPSISGSSIMAAGYKASCTPDNNTGTIYAFSYNIYFL